MKGHNYEHHDSVEDHHSERDLSYKPKYVDEMKSVDEATKYQSKSIKSDDKHYESERTVPSYHPSKTSSQYDESEPVYRSPSDHRSKTNYPYHEHPTHHEESDEKEIHYPETRYERLDNVPLQTPYEPVRLRLMLDAINRPSLMTNNVHPPLYKPPRHHHEESSYHRRPESPDYAHHLHEETQSYKKY